VQRRGPRNSGSFCSSVRAHHPICMHLSLLNTSPPFSHVHTHTDPHGHPTRARAHTSVGGIHVHTATSLCMCVCRLRHTWHARGPAEGRPGAADAAAAAAWPSHAPAPAAPAPAARTCDLAGSAAWPSPTAAPPAAACCTRCKQDLVRPVGCVGRHRMCAAGRVGIRRTERESVCVCVQWRVSGRHRATGVWVLCTHISGGCV